MIWHFELACRENKLRSRKNRWQIRILNKWMWRKAKMDKMSRASQSQSTNTLIASAENEKSSDRAAKNFVWWILWVGQWECEFVIDWLLLLFFTVLLADFVALSTPKRGCEAFLLHYAIFYAGPDLDMQCLLWTGNTEQTVNWTELCMKFKFSSELKIRFIVDTDPDPKLAPKNIFLNFWNWKWIFKRQQKNFWALIGILPIGVLCFQFNFQFFFLHFHRNSKNSKLVIVFHQPL